MRYTNSPGQEARLLPSKIIKNKSITGGVVAKMQDMKDKDKM
jgi:hypothetical protein